MTQQELINFIGTITNLLRGNGKSSRLSTSIAMIAPG